jgi:hypothetical protein
MEIVQQYEHLIQNLHLLHEFKIYNYTSMARGRGSSRSRRRSRSLRRQQGEAEAQAESSESIADIKQQQEINKAFTKAGYSINTLNNLTQQIAIANNPTAAKKIKKADLKKILIEAQENLKNAPDELNTAEKNYYTTTLGKEEWEKMLLDKYKKEFEKENIMRFKKHQELMRQLNTLSNDYSGLYIYFNRMMDYINMKKDKEKNLLNFLDKNNRLRLTNDRKVIYEEYEIEWLDIVRKGLLSIYYILLAWIIIRVIMRDKNYKNYITLLIILVIIILPLISLNISKYLFYIYFRLYYLLNNNVPKNVYTNI